MVFFIGLVMSAALINSIQLSKAKRKSFRQMASIVQVLLYCWVILGYMSVGNTPAFYFWSMLAFFLSAITEGIEVGLIAKRGNIGGIQREDEKEKILVVILGNTIVLLLPLILFLVSLSLITGYIPPFLK